MKGSDNTKEMKKCSVVQMGSLHSGYRNQHNNVYCIISFYCIGNPEQKQMCFFIQTC